jgi:hypothetical protein
MKARYSVREFIGQVARRGAEPNSYRVYDRYEKTQMSWHRTRGGAEKAAAVLNEQDARRYATIRALAQARRDAAKAAS